MSLIGAGSWNGGMQNANTFWGLTRKIGPYKQTAYDKYLAGSREASPPGAKGMWVIATHPPPFIQTKPFPGMFHYDTPDVVGQIVSSHPNDEHKMNSKVPGFRNGIPRQVKGKKNLRDTQKRQQEQDNDYFTNERKGPVFRANPYFVKPIDLSIRTEHMGYKRASPHDVRDNYGPLRARKFEVDEHNKRYRGNHENALTMTFTRERPSRRERQRSSGSPDDLMDMDLNYHQYRNSGRRHDLA